MTDLKSPSDCNSKTDIRTAIDAIDEELLQTLARRQTYVRRMADLKQHPDQAFDHERIETMVDALKSRAKTLGLEGEQVELVWRALIDWNVAFEKRSIAARLAADESV
ncbi:MAG: chorismate mutase [Roseibium sp.]